MAADDTDLLAAAMADEAALADVVPARDDHEPPSHAPAVRRDNWLPRMNDGGQEAIFFEAEADAITAVGPKGSGKTDGCLNRLVRHCYENHNALALIIGITQRVATEGAGFDLVDRILPMWRDGNRYPLFAKDPKTGLLTPHPKAGELMDEGIGLEFTKWTLDPVTKDRHLWIANRFGGWSKVLLVSIQHASEVQKKLFGIQPSLVYIEELMNADGPEYYSVPYAQLGRRRGITGPQIWMASLNTESPEHWTHALLYKDCVVASGGRRWPDDPEKPGIMRDRKWAVFYIWFEENAHNLPAGYRERLALAYRADPTLAKRMLDAKWIAYPSGEAIFKESYAEDRHVYGDKEKSKGLLPSKGHPIVIGYDPGSANPAMSFEQIVDTTDGTATKIFDELAFYQTHVNYYRFTKMMMEKMLYWQRRVDYLFEFRFIADDQATTAFNPSKGSTTARDIEDNYRQIREADPQRYATLPTTIRWAGCPKPPGSRAARVNIVADAQFENRLMVSAACPVHRAMFLNLERDPQDHSEPKRSKHLHPFDSFSYPLFYRKFVLKAPFRELGSRNAVEIVIG
ncbi:MAG: terminase family protein [Candidatus Didemnitutus sp.]|nr:terminase family protein [Candidatus Didemnitutus sp.]